MRWVGRRRERGRVVWVSVNMCAQDTLTKLAQPGVKTLQTFILAMFVSV